MPDEWPDEWDAPRDWFREEQDLSSHARERREAAGAVADLVQAEWVNVSLSSRLAASADRQLTIATVDGATSTGVIADVGRDWLVLRRGEWETFVRLSLVATVSGLGPGSHAATSSDRTSEGIVWREWAARRRRCQWGLVDRRVVTGTTLRVGQDALDIVQHPVDRSAEPGDAPVVVPYTAISWARSIGRLDRD